MVWVTSDAGRFAEGVHADIRVTKDEFAPTVVSMLAATGTGDRRSMIISADSVSV
jgi:hypothetical protein